MPQAVEVDPVLIAAAADHRHELAALGLELEEFGGVVLKSSGGNTGASEIEVYVAQ